MPTYCTCGRKPEPHAPSGLCLKFAEAQRQEAIASCPGFDPGDVLAAYGGRKCIHCGVLERNHPL